MEGSKGRELDQYLAKLIKSGASIELNEKWVNPDSKLQQFTEDLFPEECQNHRVFAKRSGKRPKNTVTIRSVKGTKYENLYDPDNLSIYAGGPGSMVGASLDSVLSSTHRHTSRVMYATYDFEHSNARSSAYYFHVRHSNALDADSWVRGHRILKEFLHRQSLSREKLLSEARHLEYMKVDLSVVGITSSGSHFLKTLAIMCGGLWHTCRNVAIEKVDPSATDWAHNRAYSQNSIPVLRFLESAGKQLGIVAKDRDTPTLLTGTEADSSLPKAIHVVFDEKGAKHTEEDNNHVLVTNQIRSQQLSHTELVNVMGGNRGDIYKAYVYPEDGRISANMNLVLRDIVEKSGHTWKEGVAVESVYVDKDGVRGVEFRDAVTSERYYQPCSSVVLSLGYTAQYQLEQPAKNTNTTLSGRVRKFVSLLKWKAGFKGPVPSTTTAAGCSGYFLVRGKIPIIGAQNSHWTEVAYSPKADVTLAKLTGGGNIGSEHIPATYAINNLEHLRRMFKDRLIDVLSVDSCPRAINPQNDVQFYKVVPGLVISLGLGGTGMTKSGANGALSYLLSHPEVSPSDLIPTAPNLFDSISLKKFVQECTPSTLRALGLQTDYSLFEVIFFLGICLGVYFARKIFPPLSQSTSHHHYYHPSSPSLYSSPSISAPYRHFSFSLPKSYHRWKSFHSYSTRPPPLCSGFSVRPPVCCNLRLLATSKNLLCRIRL